MIRPTTRSNAWVAGCLALFLAATTPALGVSAEPNQEELDLQTRLERFVGLWPGGAAAITVRDGQTTTAAAGILDIGGDPVEPGSPFLIGILGASISTAIVLQLVDEGLVDLDELVTTYLPDAPVAGDATVRDLLDARAGVPDNYGQLVDLSLADPGHTWTLEEVTGLLDQTDASPAGVFAPSFSHDFVTMRLIETIESTDFPTVLATRIAEPLGLAATAVVGGKAPPLPGIATGWEVGIGYVGDPDDEIEAMQTIDGRTSSVLDMAMFLQAMSGGTLLSDEMTALVFDENTVFYGMGFDAHETAFGDMGDIGAHWFPMTNHMAPGYSGTMAIDPVNGDLVVVLTSNVDFDTGGLVREIVGDWATADG